MVPLILPALGNSRFLHFLPAYSSSTVSALIVASVASISTSIMLSVL
jgi:hypothetical protein